MSEKMIGLVAGVGPFAGADLFNKILDETIANKDQDHLTVLSLSGPREILDRTEYLLGHVAENPGHAMGRQLQLLARSGAEVIGIPCNTAHAPPIFEVIQAAAPKTVRLLHMIEETGRFLKEERPFLHNIGILSTTGTYLTQIYPQILEPMGYQVIVPDLTMQEEKVHPAIYHPKHGLKACGLATAQASEQLTQAINQLQEAGAEAIVLGCTEIPLAFPEPYFGKLPLIDPTRVLARALIREASPVKLKPINERSQ